MSSGAAITKAGRTKIADAEACGLTYISHEMGGTHLHITFENAHGQRMISTMSSGARELEGRALKNDRSQFRRFARGQIHGLIIVETAHAEKTNHQPSSDDAV